MVGEATLLLLASGDGPSAARVVDSPLADFESELPSASRVPEESVGAALLPFVSTSNCGKAATPAVWEVNAANVRMIEQNGDNILQYEMRAGWSGDSDSDSGRVIL